ncbi:MAG: enoyl-CoA hydratase/isomerase family protein [Acidobacteria bacterium]|nr:enoyl-CoA hydratase/isomerase family protein [Acidobacteriota bacterium]
MEKPVDDKVLLRLEPPVAVLVLNDPEIRNPLSPDMVLALQAALDRVEQERQVKVVILTGAGKAFSAGVDLNSLRRMTESSAEQSRQDSMRVAGLFRRIYLFGKPVIAAVNGPAVAGGCGLMSVCDLSLAAPEARFGYSEVKVGFIPALVMVFLLRQVGEKTAKELLLTGRMIQPEQALRLGLINEIVPADQLLARAREVALEIVGNSPDAVTLTKQLVAHQHGQQLLEALELAVNTNSLVRTTDNFREGVTAFLEKRKPEWK